MKSLFLLLMVSLLCSPTFADPTNPASVNVSKPTVTTNPATVLKDLLDTAALAFRSGDYPRMNEAFAKALTLSPGDPEVLTLLGLVSEGFAKKQPDEEHHYLIEAENYLRIALNKEEPSARTPSEKLDLIRIQVPLARVLIKLGREADGEKLLRQATDSLETYYSFCVTANSFTHFSASFMEYGQFLNSKSRVKESSELTTRLKKLQKMFRQSLDERLSKKAKKS